MAELNQEVAYIAPGPRTFTCSEAITPSGCVVQLDADGRVSIADAADDFLLGIAAHTTDAAGDNGRPDVDEHSAMGLVHG